MQQETTLNDKPHVKTVFGINFLSCIHFYDKTLTANKLLIAAIAKIILAI